MTRIDLTPKFWRDRFRVRRALRVFGMALLVTLIVMGAFRGFLAWQMSEARGAMARMATEKAVFDQAMEKNQREFKQLEALRAKAARMTVNGSVALVDRLLKPLDDAMVDGVTLGDMSVQMAEIAPAGTTPPAGGEWARVVLQGESTGAQGLTLLTNRLTETPGWKHLKVGRLVPHPSGAGLEFSLEADVMIKNTPGVK